MKIDKSDDIRNYINNFKNNTTIRLFLERTPFELDPTEGAVDEYYVLYNSNGTNLSEKFFSLKVKNITDKTLIKGIIEPNVDPVTEYGIEKIWAQLGHRINFINTLGIKNQIFYENQEIFFEKKLPKLHYNTKIDYNLLDIINLAKEKFWDYKRCTHLWEESAILIPKTSKKLTNSEYKTFN